MLHGLDKLAGLATDNKDKPDNIDYIFYTFLEMGVPYDQVCNQPIPYLLAMLKTHSYIKNEELKAHKKAHNK